MVAIPARSQYYWKAVVHSIYIFAGKPSTFQVITTNSGHGTLNVTVEGPSRVAIRCTEIDEGYQFTYTPMKVGDYLINIKYSNVTIAACPRLARVTGRPMLVRRVAVLFLLLFRPIRLQHTRRAFNTPKMEVKKHPFISG